MIDYIAIPKSWNHRCRRTKVIPVREGGSDHKVLMIEIYHRDHTNKHRQRRTSLQRDACPSQETDIERRIRELFRDTVRTQDGEKRKAWNASERTLDRIARLSLAMAIKRLLPGNHEAIERVIKERKKEAAAAQRIDVRRHLTTRGRDIMQAAKERNIRQMYNLLRPFTPKGKKMSGRQTLSRRQRKEINEFFDRLYKKHDVRSRNNWVTPELQPRPAIREDPWTHWYVNASVNVTLGTTLVAVRADRTSPGSEQTWTEIRRKNDEGRRKY